MFCSTINMSPGCSVGIRSLDLQLTYKLLYPILTFVSNIVYHWLSVLLFFMEIAFIAYNYHPEFHSPVEWISRISPFAGVMEALAKKCSVHYVGRINHEGELRHLPVASGICHAVRSEGDGAGPREQRRLLHGDL